MGLKREYRRYSRPVLKTRRWQLLRAAVLERDGWACVDCGQTRGRLEVDHVLPVRDRPDLSFDSQNCATRCPACHAAKTAREVGFAPTPPDRLAWRKSVAELASASPTPAMEL